VFEDKKCIILDEECDLMATATLNKGGLYRLDVSNDKAMVGRKQRPKNVDSTSEPEPNPKGKPASFK